MDEEEATTFSQGNLPCVSFAALENMRKQDHLCDLRIKVQNHSFFAHRAILAAAIPYFENVFSSCAVETGETEIAVEELDPQALESLIRFVYTSEVRITLKNVQSLLVASVFLQLNQVRDACVEFLSKRLCVDNVLRLYTFAYGLNNADLVKSCVQFILKNFELFIKCDDFLRLPHSCIKEIISDDDLNVVSEEVVFEALMKWVKASLDERRDALPELLNEVRMIYLPIRYVIDQVESNELIISSNPCRNLVSEVKSYHLLRKRGSEFPNLKKRPRNQFNFDLYSICVCDTCGCSVNRCDETIEVWSALASDKTKCGNIRAVVAVNDIIYMFLDTTIQTFHLKTRKWDILAANHNKVTGAAIVSHGNCIYCFGSNSPDYMAKVRCFDTHLNGWIQEGRVKTNRYGHAGASLGDNIYVTGGMSASYLNTVEKYSTSTGQWTDVKPMLSPRNAHSCCNMNERVYVCGGYNGNYTEMTIAEVYEPQTDQWNFISPMKNSKILLSVVTHFNKLYAFGKSDFEVYDSETNEWRDGFPVPAGFTRAVSCPSVKRKTS